MPSEISFLLLTGMIFVFTYVNGFHDGCNVVATLIASRAMRPHPALAWAAAVEFLSPFAILVVGSSVSNTIQKLVGEAFYTDAGSRDVALAFITGGILAAILWNLTTWRFGIPASSSHALIGGVVGAGIAAFGTGSISWSYFWGKIVLMIFLTPLVFTAAARPASPCGPSSARQRAWPAVLPSAALRSSKPWAPASTRSNQSTPSLPS